MLVVGKIDRELTLVFRFGRLIGIVGLAKDETRSLARRGAQVTDRADCRTSSAHCLARKKLWPVTTDAGIVIGKISDVGKIAFRVPGCRYLMTSIAGKRFVLLGCMEEARVL
jgi:hypothetical protein